MKPLRRHGGTQRRAEVAEIRQPRVSGGNCPASLVTSKAGIGALPGHTPGAHRRLMKVNSWSAALPLLDVSLQPPTGQSWGFSGPGV